MRNKLRAIWKIIRSPEYLVISTYGIDGARRETDFGKYIRKLSDAIEQEIKLDKEIKKDGLT